MMTKVNNQIKTGGIIEEEFVKPRGREVGEFFNTLMEEDKKFAQQVREEEIKLGVGVIVRELREELNLTQTDFSKLINKPQSTVGRIENGSMNPSYKVLKEIAEKTGKNLVLRFE